MTMFGSQWLANAGASYKINQSIRFNTNDTAKLTKTFGTATNRKIFTFSVWVKNGSSPGSIIEHNTTGGVTWANIQFGGNRIDYWDYSGGSARIDLRTTAVFRDPSAWYHLVVAMDTTQSTASNRLKFYINGTQITVFGTSTYPSEDFEGFINSGVAHLIGKGTNGPFDGYLAEYNFIDGQALAPTDFGEYNDAGVWIPIKYAGSYGDNGFYLTGATASDLGEDFSGNGNDFSSSGLTAADQMLDTPTTVYPTINSVFDYYTSGNTSYFRPNYGVSKVSDGNLKIVYVSPNTSVNYCTMSFGSGGKFYFEVTAAVASSLVIGIGGSKNIELGIGSSSSTAMANVIGYYANGTLFDQNATAATYGNASSIGNGEFVGVAYSVDDDAIWFCDNGTWVDGNGTENSATVLAQIEAGNTTSAASTDFTDDQNAWFPFVAAVGDYPTAVLNFGQSSFTGSAPSGFTHLNTATTASPSVKDGSEYFQTALYTGQTTAFDVTFSGNSDLAPDWLWFKARSASSDNFLFDKVRGALETISSNDTTVEETSTGSMTAFGTDGFSLGDGGSANDINGVAGTTYAAWGWAANGSGSSNEDGSVNTTATSANTTAGFSISKWTHTTSANYTVGHGLGAVPKMVIVKTTDQGTNWGVYHSGLAVGKRLLLNGTGAEITGYWGANTWNSTVFSVGSERDANGSTMVGYAFAEIPSYSSIGIYEGNGSASGSFIYTGFRPAWIMCKSIDSTSDWFIYDSKRLGFNADNNSLFANAVGAELTADNIDILSNGFKMRIASDPNVAETFMYMAFAENPFGGNGVAPATAR